MNSATASKTELAQALAARIAGHPLAPEDCLSSRAKQLKGLIHVISNAVQEHGNNSTVEDLRAALWLACDLSSSVSELADLLPLNAFERNASKNTGGGE